MNKILFNFLVIGASFVGIQGAVAMEMDIENTYIFQRSKSNAMDVENVPVPKNSKVEINAMDIETKNPFQDRTNLRQTAKDKRIKKLEEENKLLRQTVVGLSLFLPK